MHFRETAAFWSLSWEKLFINLCLKNYTGKQLKLMIEIRNLNFNLLFSTQLSGFPKSQISLSRALISAIIWDLQKDFHLIPSKFCRLFPGQPHFFYTNESCQIWGARAAINSRCCDEGRCQSEDNAEITEASLRICAKHSSAIK